MAKNEQATKEAKEPNELYDGLSQDGQDDWDAIGALGYTPEKGAKGLWFARRPGQAAKQAIGPSESLSVLVTMVRSQANADFNEEQTDQNGDAAPSTRLPGMEEPAVEELDRQADICIDAHEKKKTAAAESSDQNDIMRTKMRDHGRKRYSRRGWSLVDEESHKLVVKKAENPTKKKQNKSAE